MIIDCHTEIFITIDIKINDIQGELLLENIISSHLKIACYLHMWKDLCCFGYILSGFFRSKNEMVGIHYVYIINRTLHDHLELASFIVESISLVHCSHSWNILDHL